MQVGDTQISSEVQFLDAFVHYCGVIKFCERHPNSKKSVHANVQWIALIANASDYELEQVAKYKNEPLRSWQLERTKLRNPMIRKEYLDRETGWRLSDKQLEDALASVKITTDDTPVSENEIVAEQSRVESRGRR